MCHIGVIICGLKLQVPVSVGFGSRAVVSLSCSANISEKHLFYSSVFINRHLLTPQIIPNSSLTILQCTLCMLFFGSTLSKMYLCMPNVWLCFGLHRDDGKDHLSWVRAQGAGLSMGYPILKSGYLKYP